MSEVRDEVVRMVLDAWRRTFSLRTLGGGVVRCLLIFCEKHLVELETNQVANVPPLRGPASERFRSRSGNLEEDVFWGIVGSILEAATRAEEVDRSWEGILANLTGLKYSQVVQMIERLMREMWKVSKVNLRYVVSYGEVGEHSVLLKGNEVRIQIKAMGKRQSYHVVFTSRERAQSTFQVLKDVLRVG